MGDMILPISADKWFEGLDFELNFWSNWLGTKGGPWPEDYRARLNPNKPFDQLVENAIPDTGSREIEILDVGSGPITSLGYVCKKFDIRITAVDPLADAYSVLLQNAGVTAPITTQKCFGENLLNYFGDRHFDVCHSRNALDHSMNPLVALRAMAQLLRPGGLMYVRVHKNEGENAHYSGLHNWNFDKDEMNNFVLWRASEHYRINEELSDLVDGQLAELVAEYSSELVFTAYRKAT